MLAHLAYVDAEVRSGKYVFRHRQPGGWILDHNESRIGRRTIVDHVEPILTAKARRFDPLIRGQRDWTDAFASLDLDVPRHANVDQSLGSPTPH